MWVKNVTDSLRFCYLNIPCLRINTTLIFMSSSSDQFTHKTDISVGFRRPYLCPLKGDHHGVSIQSLIKVGKTFFRISSSHINYRTNLILGEDFCVYLSSFISQILDLLYWLVCIFIIDGMTVKTQNKQPTVAPLKLLKSTHSTKLLHLLRPTMRHH